MRASEVRAAVISAIQSITVDDRAGLSDRYVCLDQPRDPEVAQDRAFRVSLQVQPSRDPESNTCDGMIGTWTLSVFHPWTAEVEDRIAEDGERIDKALSDIALVALNEDIQHVTCTPIGVFETASLVTPRWSLVVQYRCHEVIA